MTGRLSHGKAAVMPIGRAPVIPASRSYSLGRFGSGATAAEPEQRTVPIASLRPADTPRSGGEDEAHVMLLAGTQDELPPVLVHRATMRVIDGVHRVRAAQHRGEDGIRVEFFDGSEDDAFIRSVELNVAHGLPLSLGDRKAAADRILSRTPHMSDRAVALIAGLSPKTVATIRRRVTVENGQLHTRLGNDGKKRPVDAIAGRRRAAEMIAEKPHASLREVAAFAGISPGTVRDVRRRLSSGDDPIRCGTRPANKVTVEVDSGRTDQSTVEELRQSSYHPPSVDCTVLSVLSKDPTLRLTETGRALLRWLHGHVIRNEDWETLLASVPEHCTPAVVALAQRTADAWREFAQQLEHRDGKLNRTG
jgi:DNA-binding CsgD family transcriptional regulator